MFPRWGGDKNVEKISVEISKNEGNKMAGSF